MTTANASAPNSGSPTRRGSESQAPKDAGGKVLRTIARFIDRVVCRLTSRGASEAACVEQTAEATAPKARAPKDAGGDHPQRA